MIITDEADWIEDCLNIKLTSYQKVAIITTKKTKYLSIKMEKEGPAPSIE
jgi:hypothetical protein